MNYLYFCIAHFKQTDTNDILQGEYTGLHNVECGNVDSDMDADMDADIDGDINAGVSGDDEPAAVMSYNCSMMRKIVKPNTLDNFIIRNVIKKNDAEHLPVQKEINLKDPELKVKGIVKKKNLTNTYEEEENPEKTEVESEQSEENHT